MRRERGRKDAKRERIIRIRMREKDGKRDKKGNILYRERMEGIDNDMKINRALVREKANMKERDIERERRSQIESSIERN